MRWRLPVLLLALALSGFGATVRLYLKDGTYQLVREYQVLPDRVKYLSVERTGEWEEIPLELVDLNRTKREVAEHEQQLKLEAKEDAEEEGAIREAKQEAASVPDDPGAYYVRVDKLEPMKEPDLIVTHDKSRTVLKILSPFPVVSGKNTVEIEGAASALRVNGDRPEMYVRLNAVDAVAIIKLTPKKTTRVVETVSIESVTKEMNEKRDTVPTFTKQVGEELMKIWPEQPMLPGEYAVIEFGSEAQTLQVWDFGVGVPGVGVPK
jgi:hypothetical protein